MEVTSALPAAGEVGVVVGRDHVVPLRVYTIKLRWPWCWKHSLNCTFAPLQLSYKHTTQLKKKRSDSSSFFFSMLVTDWSGRRKRERTRGRERERREEEKDILSGDPTIYEIILAFTRVESYTSSPPTPRVGLQVSQTKAFLPFFFITQPLKGVKLWHQDSFKIFSIFVLM